jgi:excisionase family DNA binding protein
MPEELYSVDQVAERLGLHVRTVRNYVREGKLKAVRIGKQYRIAREDLEAFTGQPAPRLHRRVEVSSIVQIDAIDSAEANRLALMLIGLTNGPRENDGPLRIENVYDEERGSLKIIILGSAETTAELLKIIGQVAVR